MATKENCVEDGSMYCNHTTNEDQCETDKLTYGDIQPKLVEKIMTNAFKEFTNDSPDKVENGAIKYDGGKSPIFRGGLSYFPLAIGAVAEVSAFGASKYAWNGWRGVDDGYNRYSDAMVRHLAYEGSGEVLDPDSGLLHAAHAAWNALARLELLIEERKREKNSVG